MDASIFFLSLCIFIEACIFCNRWDPIYSLLPISCLIIYTTLRHFLFNKNKIYLIDFSCLTPHPKLRVPTSALLEHIHLNNQFDQQSIDFMSKIITASGQGEETYLPPAMRIIPPKTHHQDFITEAQLLLFPALDNLLSKTNLKPTDIDILVVTCSLFCPSPSLSSIVVNHFNMREDIKSFNVSGTGCSGGAIAVDLASNLLQIARRRSYAVILSTEVLSPAWYSGQDRSKLLINCTFRMGSSALLLTNKRHIGSKYQLVNMVRTNYAFDNAAHNVSMLEDDSRGIVGFTVKRDIMRVVREVILSNATSLGKEILPFDEKVRYILWCIRNMMLRKGCDHREAFVPNFGRVIQHYCMPTIAKAVIEEVGKGLGLRERDTEAAAMTFHRFGNTSAAAMWYQVAYMEAKGRMKRRDKVWMIAFGSGCKCNSMVWKCIGELKQEAEEGPWSKSIDKYPIDLG